MSGNLTTRVKKMETKVRATVAHVPKLIRLCVTDEDVAAVYREAGQRGLDPDEVMVIHLVPLMPAKPHLRLAGKLEPGNPVFAF